MSAIVSDRPRSDERAISPAPLVDGDSAAWLASLVFHLCVLAVLTAVTLALPAARNDLDLAYQPIDLVEE